MKESEIEMEKKLMRNALSCQKTLAKMLGPLNGMSPVVSSVEQQMRLTYGLASSLEQIQKQLQPIQNVANQSNSPLSGLLEGCREVIFHDEVPVPIDSKLFLTKESEKQISDLKEEIASLKNEIKTEREERKKSSLYEHLDVYGNRLDPVEKKLERSGIEIKSDEVKVEYSPQELLVLSYSSQFRKDYKKLIEIGYMRRKKDGFLEWLKSKQSLAEYFGSQESHGRWCDIENLFQEKGLNHLLSVAMCTSKDFRNLEKLLEM